MTPAPNTCKLPVRLKRVPPRPAPVRSSLGRAALILHVVGYVFWALFCFLFEPDGGDWCALLSFALGLFCPLLALLWALVGLVTGASRRLNGLILGLSVFLPIVYLLMVSELM